MKWITLFSSLLVISSSCASLLREEKSYNTEGGPKVGGEIFLPYFKSKG